MKLLSRGSLLFAACLLALYLWYFADHARLMLAHPYPLDYGEGPLLAQVEQLRSGTPIPQLYADPAQPPYLIINYPPLYLLLTAWLSIPLGSVLVAGRLLSLLGALGCVAAIGLLAGGRRSYGVWIAALLLLSVPVVREWAALMRVDLLGIAFGLWGLLLLLHNRHGRIGIAFAGGLLLVAGLYVKPSLIAAPGTALLWLFWQWWRSAAGERMGVIRQFAALIAALALGGGLFGLLQVASDGWFALHVVAANANRWEFALAQGFWTQQLRLRWPLLAAALLVIWLQRQAIERLLPALLYSGLGLVTAVGVGKVGAYSNYFLELYAGLIWLIALGVGNAAYSMQHAEPKTQHPEFELRVTAFAALVAASMIYYPPLWDTERLRPAGLIEPSPPQIAIGRYGVWDDAAREADLLAALARVGAALNSEVQAAGPLLFSDLPGVAAAAGVTSRIQVFEARQLFDQGLADQTGLLAELANGELPLATIDYLGNWLTPEMIVLLQRRYAQDGAYGTLDLFRPVAAGLRRERDLPFPAVGLRLDGYRLVAPLADGYEPGELLTLTLEWLAPGAETATPPVHISLRDGSGEVRAESERPLLYGVFPPAHWPHDRAIQHMQPLALPADLPAGRYSLHVAVADSAPQPLAEIVVQPAGGMLLGETGHFVPARLMRAWAEFGGVDRAGYPLTPLVPFEWGRLQCFERTCLELRNGNVVMRALGRRMYLAETVRGARCENAAPAGDALCPAFHGAPEHYGAFGSALSGELSRNGWIVQWTDDARLERAPGTTAPIGLGRLGDESLRLAPGQTYRWP